MPIYTIDDQPLASRLLTHNVIAKISICNHMEVTSLGICSMPYLVLLGLDWLRHHNPAIDWTRGQLSLSCCGNSLSVPAFGRGYSLVMPSASSFPPSVTSIGLGPHLSNLKFSPWLGVSHPSTMNSYPAGIFINLQAPSSVLRPPCPNGTSRAELKAIWATPPETPSTPELLGSIDIAIVEPEHFHKYAKNLEIGCIWYTTNSELNA